MAWRLSSRSCIFTASTVILEPLITKIARQNAPYLLGGIALVTTFVGLLVTTLVTDGLSITGIATWVMATLIIWLATVVASLVLPLFLFKEALGKRNKAKEVARSAMSGLSRGSRV